MKNRQVKTLIIAGLALAGLVAVGLLAFMLLGGGPDSATGETEVFSVDTSAITRISVLGGETSEDYSLVPTEDGAFYFEKPDENFEYLPQAFSRVPNGVSLVKVNRVIEDRADDTTLAKYGLQPAQTTVTIELEGGKVQTLLIGFKTGTNTGYYMALEGEGKVYQISEDTLLSIAQPESYYRDFEILPDLESSLLTLTYLKLTKPDGTVPLEVKTPDFDPKPFDARATSLYLLEPFEDYASLAGVWNDVLSNLYQDTVHYGYVEDYPQDLSKYGLDEGQFYRIEIENAEGETLNLRLAAEKNDLGYYYAYKEGTPSVFQLAGSFAFFDKDPLKFAPVNVWLYEHRGISKLSITGLDGAEHVIDYRRTEAGDDLSGALFDGKEVDEINLRHLYTRVLFIGRSGYAEGVDTAPAMSVVAEMVNGDRHEMLFRPINEREFDAEIDGVARYRVGLPDLKSVSDALRAIAEGRAVA